VDYTISLTNKCNLKCSYCYERHLNTEYGSLSDETRDKIADYINAAATPTRYTSSAASRCCTRIT